MLLGRHEEIQAIDRLLEDARSGRSARLVIRGEPGIGKTALLEHATSHAGPMRLLAARGVEFEADLPFAGLHELLRPALGSISRLTPVHASALSSSLGLGTRIEADRLIVGAAVLELVSAYAEEAPVLVTVDDAQWLDLASAEAIAFVARRLLADPVAILVAVREGDGSPFLAAGLPELRLAGLDLDSAAGLLAKGSATQSSAEFVRRMVEATGGNPLALVELGRAASLEPVSPHDALPVATSVERAYLRRLAGLSDGARRYLLLLAAAGAPEHGLVERAADSLDIDAGDIEVAEAAAGLVAPRGDRVEFVHPLARAAVYHSASPTQRRAAHRALASVMTEPSAIDRRAWHLAAAATGWDEAAAKALEDVALRSRESTGYDAAASALAESARLTEPGELRAERLFRAAENAWLAGRGERAVELLTSARKLARTVEHVSDIDALLGHIAMRRSSVIGGYRTLMGAADAIQPTDRLKAIRILADAAISTFGAGNPGNMLAAATRAIDMLRPTDPPASKAFAYVAYGALAILAGRGTDGPNRLHESVPLLNELPSDSVDPLVLTCECICGLFLREARAGRELLGRALDQAREHAPTAALPAVLFMLGRDAAATDRWQVARANYEEAARIARETTQFTWLCGVVAGLAWLDALEGREAECRAHAEEARRLSEEYGQGFYKSWSMIALGQLELGLGRPEAALDHLIECSAYLAEIAIVDPDLSPVPDIVDAQVRRGLITEAREAAARYGRDAEAKGQPFALARAARARALVAGDDDYAREFEAALLHHESTPDVFERARTQLYYGERLRRARRRIDARLQLRAALKTFDEQGASPWAERALAELEASGETARVRDDRYRQQLTPQELQVALTLAEGATTREAAARLYLSPKTVEYHLRHVYDKLEIRTREELRTALMNQGRPDSRQKTLMFTDLAGSTSLVEAMGDAAWNNLSEWLDGEMRRLFAEHQGREVDHAGDGFFVVFESAAGAIDCAVTIQRRLLSHRRLHGFAPQVRIGIHSGEVSDSGSSLRGAAVHRAARLCAAADAGTILASSEALEAAGRRASGLRKVVMKGIKEPVEAAEIRWDTPAAGEVR